jgi:hypothetical protein
MMARLVAAVECSFRHARSIATIVRTPRAGTCSADTTPASRGIRIAPAKTPVKRPIVEREDAAKLYA